MLYNSLSISSISCLRKTTLVKHRSIVHSVGKKPILKIHNTVNNLVPWGNVPQIQIRNERLLHCCIHKYTHPLQSLQLVH